MPLPRWSRKQMLIDCLRIRFKYGSQMKWARSASRKQRTDYIREVTVGVKTPEQPVGPNQGKLAFPQQQSESISCRVSRRRFTTKATKTIKSPKQPLARVKIIA